MTPRAAYAAALLAVDPIGLGGAVLRGPVSPARDAWLAALRAVLPDDTPWRRLPPQIAESRLIGGLDLAATLTAGRPVAEHGLLAEASGGVVLVPMAERLAAETAGILAAALDTGEVVVERDGIAARQPTRFATILLDEGIEDERAPAALAERVAFALHMDALSADRQPLPPPFGEGLGVGVRGTPREPEVAAIPALNGKGGAHAGPPPLTPPHKGEGGRWHRVSAADIALARAELVAVEANDEIVEALAAAGLAFGVASLRVVTFALRAAKASAALAGRDVVASEDAEIAAALVIAPRATTLPASDEAEPPPEEAPPPEAAPEEPTDTAAQPDEGRPMADKVVDATRAAIPADILAMLSAAAAPPRHAAAGGRAGAAGQSARRGRPTGVRRGAPGHGVRLALVETLRAAAPWQPLRRRAATDQGRESTRILVRREDFRIARFKERTETLTIFVVDASGSAALHRLAEVKGAVELVLADCYVRRDWVALIAFRGERAELVLPPTRSLARAKRALAGQPGGGGTPLAAGIEAAALLAHAATRKGQAPLVVLLTDGKANVARSRRPGRAEAEADSLAAAQAFRLGAAAALVLDIAPRPSETAGRLAQVMGARYIPLPYADARLVSRAVQSAGPAA